MSALVVRGGVDPSGVAVEVSVVDGIVSPSIAPDATVLDAAGLVVAPGLVDLQVNGAGGVDVTADPARLSVVGEELVRHGVTAFLPTVITSAPEARAGALDALATAEGTGAVPLGVHLEGPMIAPSRRGAHPEEWLRTPSLALVDGWSREAGVVMVTIAPELPGAVEVIAALVARGVVVSVGHTAATPAHVAAAVGAGATCATHLFNAMPPISGRDPGPAGAVLGRPDVVAGLIVDGIHLSDEVVRMAWRALGPARFWSVSDTTAALGLGDGPVRLGDQDAVVADGAVRLADGTLAGSASSLADCVRTLWATTGCSLAEALATATSTPARLIGDDSRGSLRVGGRGDLVLLDVDHDRRHLEVVATVVGGTVALDRREG